MHRPADGLTLPSLPPQRTDRIPKDIHVEPERFAAELISKLEGVLRQREAEEKLEERLKRVRLVRFKPTSFPARSPPPAPPSRTGAARRRCRHCCSATTAVLIWLSASRYKAAISLRRFTSGELYSV